MIRRRNVVLAFRNGLVNAGSSVKYPLQFSKARREVETTGEVYFEVAHQPDRPFRVRAGKQLLKDIGTTFNIGASADGSVNTTLVEGIAGPAVTGCNLYTGKQ